MGAASGSNMATQPVVTAKNADGTTNTSFVGNVTVALNTLTGTPSLTGTATVAAVAGVATFSGLGTTGGASTWTLTASATSYTSATSSTGTTTGGFAGQFQELFSTTPLSGNANWALSGVGTNGGYVDSPSGELRCGTTGSFGAVAAQAKMTTAFILGAVGVHDLVWEWTAGTNQQNHGADIWIVDASGNGFGVQTMSGGVYSLQSVTVAANVPSAGIAFLPIGTVPSPVTGSPGPPLYLRFSQNGTNWAIDYSADGVTFTSWTSGTLVSASNPVTTAMNLVFIGRGNGGNGTAAEVRFDNVRWT